MSIRAIIADDEILARARLRRLLLSETDIEIISECSTGSETVASIQKHSPDLLILDVDMPEKNAFEIMGSFDKNRLPVTLLVTAHQQFAIRAFDAQVADYILKPVSPARFQQALLRARELLNLKNERSLESASTATPSPSTGRFAVKSKGRIQFVKWSEIQWIGSADNYSELHTGNTVHLLRQSLGRLELQLHSNQFVRIGRSFLVNMDHVKEFRPKSHGDYLVVLLNGKQLAGSRNYRYDLQRVMGKAAL
ncbi:MAG: lytT [Verrucomicrobiales bacterium]|nr:lytT [Verrucomicrobiales bacterium]